MDNVDSVTKQYILFSLVIGFILSFILNFIIIDIFKGTLIYGFPLGLSGVEGITSLIFKLINTIVLGLIIAIPVYMTIMYFLKRQR